MSDSPTLPNRNPDERPRHIACRGVVAAMAALFVAGFAIGAAIGPGPQSSFAGPAHSQGLFPSALSPTSSPSASHPHATPAISPQPTPAPATSPAGDAFAAASAPTAGSNESPSSSGSPGAAPPPTSSGDANSPAALETTGSATAPRTPKKDAPTGLAAAPTPIEHVWLIVLSGQSLTGALAQPTLDPYLSTRLAPQGAFLSDYSLPASSALANGVALLSGQGPNAATEANCPTYSDVQPATLGAGGLATGSGCVYPPSVQTLPDELTAEGRSWRAYLEGMDGATGAAASCRHPVSGQADPFGTPRPGDAYLDFRNPFVYFHSLLDGGACAQNDVDLQQLARDLADPQRTPRLSWIVPAACHDGAETPCAPGAPAGLAGADAFLSEVVPQIAATEAYREHGLIAIVSDSAPPTSSPASAAGAAAGTPVGALLLSPFVGRGQRVSTALNTYSLLKSLQRLFKAPLLGHAADPGVEELGSGVYRPAQAAPHARLARAPRTSG